MFSVFNVIKVKWVIITVFGLYVTTLKNLHKDRVCAMSDIFSSKAWSMCDAHVCA